MSLSAISTDIRPEFSRDVSLYFGRYEHVMVDTDRAFREASNLLQESARGNNRWFAALEVQPADNLHSFGSRLFEAAGMGSYAGPGSWSSIAPSSSSFAIRIRDGVDFKHGDLSNIANTIAHLMEIRASNFLILVEDRESTSAPFMGSTKWVPATGKTIETVTTPSEQRVSNLGFDPSNGTLLLPVERSLFGLNGISVQADGKTFEAKSELHVTLIGFKAGRQIKDAIRNESNLAERIAEVVHAADVTCIPTADLFLISKLKNSSNGGNPILAASIIQMVHLSGAERLLGDIEKVAKVSLPRPLFHATLFTHADPHGIALVSAADFEACNPARMDAGR